MARMNADQRPHFAVGGGLRRIEPSPLPPPKWSLSSVGEEEEGEEFGSSDAGSAIYNGHNNNYAGAAPSACSIISSAAFALEEQKRQLFGICEMVQSNLRALLDQIARIANGIGGGQHNGVKPVVDLLSEYELGAWPILVDVDSQVKLLSKTVRQTIDSCNINEPRLSWLLAVNKFQVKIEKMLAKLVANVAPDIERILRLRVRCDIAGLELKRETVEAIREMQTDIRSNQ